MPQLQVQLLHGMTSLPFRGAPKFCRVRVASLLAYPVFRSSVCVDISRSLFQCIIVNANRRAKDGGRPGMRLEWGDCGTCQPTWTVINHRYMSHKKANNWNGFSDDLSYSPLDKVKKQWEKAKKQGELSIPIHRPTPSLNSMMRWSMAGHH